MKTKPLILSFLVMAVFMSCLRNKKKEPTVVNEFEKAEKEVVKKFNTYCFFELDDKYSVEEDSMIIAGWLREKSQILLKNDSTANLFDQNGGGPNGAQWNPSTDIYIAIVSSSDEATELPKLYINGELYQKQIYEQGHNIIWYMVSQDFWKQELRKIDSLDIQKMYSPEFLKGIKNGEFHPSAALNYGEILRIEIVYKKEKMTKFFHATYGE